MSADRPIMVLPLRATVHPEIEAALAKSTQSPLDGEAGSVTVMELAVSQ